MGAQGEGGLIMKQFPFQSLEIAYELHSAKFFVHKLNPSPVYQVVDGN